MGRAWAWGAWALSLAYAIYPPPFSPPRFFAPTGLDLAASASQKCQGFYYDMCMDSKRGTLKNHLVLFKPLLSLR
jgi:hypothetical protein